VLWVGHLTTGKDPLAVLDGVARAAAQLPGLQLWCAFGSAPLLDEVRRRIEHDPRLRGRVHLLGKVAHTHVETLMRATDAFVSGSHSEGSGYALLEALACGAAIAPYNLRWYEEPLDPLDYLLHAALATRYAPPLATGENLFSMQDARNLIRHGGLRADRDWLQFDPALSYGLVEYLRTLDMLAAHGWSRRRCVPHGGHQFALNIAVGLGLGGNESYPQVFAPFGGFADNCKVVDSRVTMPDIPGIGFEAKNALYAVMKPMIEARPR